jgi:uncharacterized protein related to proFAR isomerase
MENILVISRHPEILGVVVRLINQQPDWNAIGTCVDQEALQIFQQENIALVLLGNGILPEEEEKLRAELLAINPAVLIIQHYGGGSGLLVCEIRQAFEHRVILG